MALARIFGSLPAQLHFAAADLLAGVGAAIMAPGSNQRMLSDEGTTRNWPRLPVASSGAEYPGCRNAIWSRANIVCYNSNRKWYGKKTDDVRVLWKWIQRSYTQPIIKPL